ncbi:hypothetical protein [Undibacterium sp. TS12]|uniref:hypothetical protein n=1 Tax=Undibacterium sp. TS12 TaxID=2908202 RepID=UPI001F4CF620|nr:hypothetical protein [Undibacterium sp. TS12]MCH8618569.1 hypothetical protein [Undibacterium sp. TS12]
MSIHQLSQAANDIRVYAFDYLLAGIFRIILTGFVSGDEQLPLDGEDEQLPQPEPQPAVLSDILMSKGVKAGWRLARISLN